MNGVARRALLEEAQRHFLRAAERCMTALDRSEEREDAVAEALFFGALGVLRAAKADDEEVSLKLLVDFLARKKSESPEERIASLPSGEQLGPLRCPARDLGERGGERCVRGEGHEMPHRSDSGGEWLVALRCRVGFDDKLGGAACSLLDRHEGPCRPRERTPPPVYVPPPARGPRGICACGRPRQEHGEPAHRGGVEGTSCTKYRAAR